MKRGCLLTGGILLFFGCLGVCQPPSSSTAEEEIRDIIIQPPPPNLTPLYFAIGGLLAGLIVIAIVFKFLIKSSNPVLKGPPPETVARQKLSQIESQIEELEPNKASLAISETIKDFLSRRFKDPIRYETAEEYLSRISESDSDNPSPLSHELTEKVRTFVSISQELKFAKLREGKKHIPTLVQQAENIITAATAESDNSNAG